MKKLILLTLVLILFVGCGGPPVKQPPPPTPQAGPTPITPAPSPPLEPTPPLPSPPTKSPEDPHYEITLVSFSGAREGASTGRTQLFFSGEVRNDSPVELEGVEAVITSYNRNNDIVGIDKWHTFPSVIQPGETGWFSLQVIDYINAVRYEVSFEIIKPGILDLSAEHGVPTELTMEY